MPMNVSRGYSAMVKFMLVIFSEMDSAYYSVEANITIVMIDRVCNNNYRRDVVTAGAFYADYLYYVNLWDKLFKDTDKLNCSESV